VTNGAPIRISQEWSPNGTTWYPWKWGQKIESQKYRFRLFLYSYRGISAAYLTKWYWWRWRRNRKWEYIVDYDPAAVGAAHNWTVPAEIVSVLNDERVQVSVENPHDKNVWFSTRTVAKSGGVVAISVTQHVRGAESLTAGVATHTFAEPFGEAPTCVLTGDDDTNRGIVNRTSLSATAVGIKAEYWNGAAYAAASGTVHVIASGVPKRTTDGGSVKLIIEVMGA
jgi:hypothetical protein